MRPYTEAETGSGFRLHGGGNPSPRLWWYSFQLQSTQHRPLASVADHPPVTRKSRGYTVWHTLGFESNRISGWENGSGRRGDVDIGSFLHEYPVRGRGPVGGSLVTADGRKSSGLPPLGQRTS